MEISLGIKIVDTALWIKAASTLIINDLHLGYEEVLQRKGILVPRFQLEETKKQMQAILEKTNPTTLIINGDLKHEFGTVLLQEWREVLQFLDFCLQSVSKIIIIRGNHDPLLRFIAEKRGIEVVTQHRVDDTLVIHGDELVELKGKNDRRELRRIIIGHEHPAITIRKGSKREKYKCFLKGKWKGKELIAVPSFNPLLEGTDVLKEKVLSPFLQDVSHFTVYVVHKGEAFNFGKIKDFTKIK